MKNICLKYSMLLWIMALTFVSCKEYLDIKPNDKLATVATLTDAQLVLDNYAIMNSLYPFCSEIQSDNQYLTMADYNSRSDFEKKSYTWQKYEGGDAVGDWFDGYRAIFHVNTVLDSYSKIMNGKMESVESRNVLGSALFFRSYYFHALAQIYSPIYDVSTASTDLGLPLRTDPDFTVKSTRASVKETYDFILSDLKKSIRLLPVTPSVKSRPSRPAAYGALSRVYLSMRDYLNAGLYADSCLQLYSELIDFNSLSKTSAAPFARFNKEVIFHIRSTTFGTSLTPSRAKIDPNLYLSYNSKDLRKVIYFRTNSGANAGTYNFKGNYDGQSSTTAQSGFVFGGIVTDEMYLIRAESYARAGNTELAMKDLNTLLFTRWEGIYVPITAVNAKDALQIILAERRKELLYRGTRWTDLRRLSKEADNAVIPKRVIGTDTYQLEPGSPRYVLAIPLDAIRPSGMPQNP